MAWSQGGHGLQLRRPLSGTASGAAWGGVLWSTGALAESQPLRAADRAPPQALLTAAGV